MEEYLNQFEDYIVTHMTRMLRDMENCLRFEELVITDVVECMFSDRMYLINNRFLISLERKRGENSTAYLHHPYNRGGSFSDKIPFDISEHPFNKLCTVGPDVPAAITDYTKGGCFYIQKLHYKGYECLKYGWASDVLRRKERQESRGVFNQGVVYLKYCDDPKKIERKVKELFPDRLQSPHVSKELMPDGYTETCPAFYFDKIKEIAEGKQSLQSPPT